MIKNIIVFLKIKMPDFSGKEIKTPKKTAESLATSEEKKFNPGKKIATEYKAKKPEASVSRIRDNFRFKNKDVMLSVREFIRKLKRNKRSMYIMGILKTHLFGYNYITPD